MITFDTVFDRLMKSEGGYVNDPADPGGETNWGITWPVLHQAIGMRIVTPDTTIAKLSREQAKAIYKVLVWTAAGLQDYDPAIAYQVMDIAVHSGPTQAAILLQRAAGVAADGRIGPVSKAAIKAMDRNDLLMLLNAERMEFQTRLKNWPQHGKGWTIRNAQNLRYAAQDN